MKVKVDEDLCIGAGYCETTAPQIFELRDGISHVLVDEVPKDQEDNVRDAVDGCPSGAISTS